MKSKFNMLFEQVMKDMGKLNLPDSETMSSEMLEELAKGKNVNLNIRQEAAKNPSTPTDVLRKLAEDKFVWVRYEVARNPSTPAEAIRKLAEDNRWEVRKGVTYNPNTPVEILTKLAKDDNGSVKGEAMRQMRHRKQ